MIQYLLYMYLFIYMYIYMISINIVLYYIYIHIFMEISTPKQAQQYDSLPFWQFIVARENGQFIDDSPIRISSSAIEHQHYYHNN